MSHEPGRTFRTILVPTDFSETAGAALRWGIALARRHGASLRILHVADVVVMSGLPPAIQDQIGASLAKLEDQVRSAGVEVTTSWESGRPWDKISYAARRNCDLIVIGARGATRYLKLPLGTTADRVLRSATVPVLTVREAGGEIRLPGRVMVPTDFSEAADQALQTAIDLFAGDGTIEVTLLHACQPWIDYEAVFPTATMPNPPAEAIHEAEQLLERLAARFRSETVTISTMAREGYPASTITDEVKSTGADLIAMGTHGRSGIDRFMLGSVAERVAHHAACPVLTVGASSVAADETREHEAAASPR